MKKLPALILFGVSLLMSSAVYALQLGQPVSNETYKDLVTLALQQKPQGEELTEEQQQTLAETQARHKGWTVILIGREKCGPCNALNDALLDESNGISVSNEWKNYKVALYKLDFLEDKAHSQPNLVTAWNIKYLPTVLFFKDGQLRRRLEGFNINNAEKIMQEMRRLVKSSLSNSN